VARLEPLIAESRSEVDDKKDSILNAIVSSGENITKESDSGPVCDAGLIATAQKVEHYEIASYGTARNWARQLGFTEHANVLQGTLDEEKHADRLLTEVAERMNPTAAAAHTAHAGGL
jgi:ferritin-like metal-binding protein YciE